MYDSELGIYSILGTELLDCRVAKLFAMMFFTTPLALYVKIEGYGYNY